MALEAKGEKQSPFFPWGGCLFFIRLHSGIHLPGTKQLDIDKGLTDLSGFNLSFKGTFTQNEDSVQSLLTLSFAPAPIPGHFEWETTVEVI